MDWQATIVSLKLASITTLILGLFGAPFSYYLSQRRGFFYSVLEAFISIPLLLPPTVFGFYCLWILGPKHLVGSTLTDLFNSPIPFTFPGLLLASVLFNLPFAIKPFLIAFRALDTDLLEASTTLGKTPVATFFKVALPISFPGIATGLLMTFAHSLGEFGVVLMVGGNLPGSTRTLSIALFDQVQSMDYAAAHQTAAFLLVFSLFTLGGIHVFERLSQERRRA